MTKQKELEKIAKEIENCEVCKIDKIGVAVPGEGNPDADIVFLGEAPGKTEAKTGRPFVGRSGKLLRSLINEVGLEEENVYITSPVKYLPSYGTPKPSDIKHGKVHLQQQIDIINPKLIVLLGNTAAKAMLDQPISLLKDHGNIIEQGGMKYYLTLHPAAAIRFVKFKKLLLADFQKLKKLIIEDFVRFKKLTANLE